MPAIREMFADVC